MSQKVAVLGAGANGASIGADITEAGCDVVLIDQWPEHVQVMRQHGLRIDMPDQTLQLPVRAYHLCDVCTFTEQFDVVFLVVKAYDTRWSCQLIEPYVKTDGLVVGVQNGMTTDTIAEIVGPHRTIGCVIEIASTMFDPGVVTRHTPRGRSWFAIGGIDRATSGREHQVAALLRHCGSVETVGNIRATKWMKLVSNATVLVSTALLGLPIQEAVALPGAREWILRAGQEAFDIGVALGHPALPILGLTEQDMRQSNRVVETMLDVLLAGFVAPTTKTTVLQDWIKGRRSEVDSLNGLVVFEATRLGRSAPVNAAITDLAYRIEKGALRPDPANQLLVVDLIKRYAGEVSENAHARGLPVV